MLRQNSYNSPLKCVAESDVPSIFRVFRVFRGSLTSGFGRSVRTTKYSKNTKGKRGNHTAIVLAFRRWACSVSVADGRSIRQAVALLDAQTSPSGEFCFMSACAHAALAGLAGQAGSGVPAEERLPEAKRSMALLHQAVAMGYANVDAYRNEDALDPLRDRDDFRLLIADLVMPAEPFTPDR